MGLSEAILELENRNVGDNWEPTLGPALALALAEWRSGSRDRELRLHLLFLSWYCNVEPPHLTGLDEALRSSLDLPSVFHTIYDTFADGILEDPECLFIVGLMASLTPWLLGGDVHEWESRSIVFREHYRALLPHGLPPAYFDGRGAYGDYFAGQVVVPGGF